MLRLPFPEFLLRWFNNRKRDKTTETLNDFPHLHHQNLLRMYLLILCLQKWILSYKPTKWSPLKYHYLWGNHDNSLVRLLISSQYATKKTCNKNYLCASFSINFILFDHDSNWIKSVFDTLYDTSVVALLAWLK